jgi:hypothetical protein
MVGIVSSEPPKEAVPENMKTGLMINVLDLWDSGHQLFIIYSYSFTSSGLLVRHAQKEVSSQLVLLANFCGSLTLNA